ncbi:uncharacterized protein METZ01_LOCUS16807 [marine metagenome]|uniref:Uncharacterized protein n=1 Tax=marine metagenome TaxID=408172 RepID=A0A381PEN8_9ZZZZ
MTETCGGGSERDDGETRRYKRGS